MEQPKINEHQISAALNFLMKGEVELAIDTTDFLEEIEKGRKDLSKLVKKKITDKTGHTRTVWVRAGEKPWIVTGKQWYQ